MQQVHSPWLMTNTLLIQTVSVQWRHVKPDWKIKNILLNRNYSGRDLKEKVMFWDRSEIWINWSSFKMYTRVKLSCRFRRRSCSAVRPDYFLWPQCSDLQAGPMWDQRFCFRMVQVLPVRQEGLCKPPIICVLLSPPHLWSSPRTHYWSCRIFCMHVPFRFRFQKLQHVFTSLCRKH